MQSFNFNPSSHSHSLQDLDLQMEVMHHFADQNPSFLETLNFGGFSLENCSSQDQQQQQHLFQTTTYAHHGTDQIPIQTTSHENKRRKVIDQSKSSSSNISPMNSPSGSGVYGENRKKKILGKGKKEMKSENMEETDDFIHVRARRGQATDSHSLAERVRRAKINNKLKCLQNLVPGCHETMGMAGTLDEIINYVHSLQNQVEFLSMELAAASSCYDLSPKPEATRKAQSQQDCEMMQECKVSSDMDRRGTNSHEMEVFRDRIGELTCFRSSAWTL